MSVGLFCLGNRLRWGGHSAAVTAGGPVHLGARGVCVFITAGPMIKLCAGGEGDSEGHVL